jgi:hypothetical protein
MPEDSSHGPITPLSRAGKAIGTQRLPFHRWVTKVGSGSGTSPSSQALWAPLAAIACTSRKSDPPKTLSIRQPGAACAETGTAVSTIAAPAATAVAAHRKFGLIPVFPRSCATRRGAGHPLTTGWLAIWVTGHDHRKPFAPLLSLNAALTSGHHPRVPPAAGFPARHELMA